MREAGRRSCIPHRRARDSSTHLGRNQRATPNIGYLPLDRVYEHGFDPLQGGFKAETAEPFEIFDQWISVVPTDQIVPVPVAYDPTTGLMK